jgi:hypothetical protein
MAIGLDMNLLVNVVSASIAVVALGISIYAFVSTRRGQTYADIDSLYMELLKIGLVNPKFRNPKYTCNYKEKFDNEDELGKYDCYAYMAWNICETIYDRKDKPLFKTWLPVIVEEDKLHRKWFDNPENFHKFKDEFRTYIAKEFEHESSCS